MGLIQFTADSYARMQGLLLPPGRLWKLTGDSVILRVFKAAGDELVRVNQRMADILRESVPTTVTEMIPDFEVEFALASTGTTEERRARIVAKEKARPSFRPPDVLVAMAPYLGLDAEDLELIEISRASAISMSEDRAIYRFYVYRDPSLPGTYTVADAQAPLDRLSHSHTKGKVIESTAMICDDPYSLCDRDLIGA